MYNGFGVGAISHLSVHYCARTTKYARRKQMIDNKATFEKYGYYSTDLKPKSGKRVVSVCDVCGAVRYLKKQDYRDLCWTCSHKGVPKSAEHRKAIGDGNRGKIVSDDTRTKMSESHTGKVHTDEHRRNNSKAHEGKKKPPRTDEHCQHISAGQQGIPYEDWDGNVSNGAYCEKFDDACRARIRAKYGHQCFLCGKPQDENITKTNKHRALSVHHFDMNKDAGCNGNLWKLVPLCLHCHPPAHSKMWTARIEYLLEYAYDI